MKGCDTVARGEGEWGEVGRFTGLASVVDAIEATYAAWQAPGVNFTMPRTLQTSSLGAAR